MTEEDTCYPLALVCMYVCTNTRYTYIHTIKTYTPKVKPWVEDIVQDHLCSMFVALGLMSSPANENKSMKPNIPVAGRSAPNKAEAQTRGPFCSPLANEES